LTGLVGNLGSVKEPKNNNTLVKTYKDFYFFVDEYTDEQIREIISIFRNDFKPPKNLWIERNPMGYNQIDFYGEIFANENAMNPN
jgi:hypothetical protein